MAELRAFVGHSFGSDDAILIRKFTDYFDQVSRLVPRFSWAHAEPAESKLLNEKVLDQIKDKNLFIGICTKKEYSINQSEMRRILGPWSMVNRGSLTWKTSDWIVQEIGLAIGKGLELILLLEKGLALPGGLQGNIEYIPFNRESPELAFGKLLEMITALLPSDRTERTVTSAEISSASSPEREKPTEEARPENVDWESPKPEWGRFHYEFAYMRFSAKGDSTGATMIQEAYLRSDDADDDAERASWDAFCEYRRIVGKLYGSVGTLERLAEQHPEKTEVQRYLGLAHEYFQDYRKAGAIYEAAATRAATSAEMINIAGRAAVAYARAGECERAEKIVTELRSKASSNPDCEDSVLQTIQEISEISGDKELSVAALEGRIRLDPTDTWTRFSLAYSHSEMENADLSLLHYLKIPTNLRTLMTWNNLGVALDKFRLRVKSVDAYRQASEGGETLAMSNLSLKFISAGFMREAQSECDRALLIENYHKNMGSTLNRLKEVLDEENDKEREILESARPKADFYRKFGQAITQISAEIAGRWRGPDCVLDISVQDGKFIASGTYDREESTNALLAFAGQRSQSIRYQMSYEGTVAGRAVQARVKRTQEGAPTPTLLSIDSSRKVLMVVSEGLDALQSMEISSGSQPKFYTLTRVFTDGSHGERSEG
jgi:tetratricopeptide (TPR) repeat protein